MAKTGDKIKGFFTGEKEEDDAEKIILQTEDWQNVKGYPCTPCIVGTWKDVYESEKIVLVLCQDLVQVKMRNFFPF